MTSFSKKHGSNHTLRDPKFGGTRVDGTYVHTDFRYPDPSTTYVTHLLSCRPEGLHVSTGRVGREKPPRWTGTLQPRPSRRRTPIQNFLSLGVSWNLSTGDVHSPISVFSPDGPPVATS